MDIIEKLQQKIAQTEKFEDFQIVFYKIAKELLTNYVLKINGKEIELLEIEFYFKDENRHNDRYTHGKEEQKSAKNLLYIHSSGRGGIDISFGNGKYYGGILIKSIKIDNEYIIGQQKVFNKIIELFNIQIPKKRKYEILQEKVYEMDISLQEEKLDNQKIFISTRIGLGQNKEKYPKYLYLLYRFVREDCLKLKDSNLKEKTLIRDIDILLYDKEYNKKLKTGERLEIIEQNKDLWKNIQTLKDSF